VGVCVIQDSMTLGWSDNNPKGVGVTYIESPLVGVTDVMHRTVIAPGGRFVQVSEIYWVRVKHSV
jgi:hypothetical protein